ncbi:hypothetical protein [Maricaulis sp.]|uniref:hypothetical protein n=1 Tax=Maricaulis sp. TaxID=1486257 RepID=UPI003A8F6BBA
MTARRWKPARLMADIDGNRRAFVGRNAEIMRAMIEHGSVNSSELAPGVRLAAVVHRLKRKHSIGIASARFCNARGDGGEYAAYSLTAPARLVEYQPGKWDGVRAD